MKGGRRLRGYEGCLGPGNRFSAVTRSLAAPLCPCRTNRSLFGRLRGSGEIPCRVYVDGTRPRPSRREDFAFTPSSIHVSERYSSWPLPPRRRGLSLARQLSLCMATAAVLLSTACSDDSTAPTSTGLEALRSETPQASPEREALTRVTRLVALAMGDQGLRQRIKNDMRKAPFREHKLELSNYLHGASGGILLAKMAKEGDLPRAEVLALLTQVRPLEFYMPLARDRATWTGGDEVIVVSLLEDNGADTIPAGFTIEGTAYPLSASEPPPVPVSQPGSCGNRFLDSPFRSQRSEH